MRGEVVGSGIAKRDLGKGFYYLLPYIVFSSMLGDREITELVTVIPPQKIRGNLSESMS